MGQPLMLGHSLFSCRHLIYFERCRTLLHLFLFESCHTNTPELLYYPVVTLNVGAVSLSPQRHDLCECGCE
jgi:hypothetical protein